MWVAAAVLSAFALIAAVGTHSAKTAVTPNKAAASRAASPRDLASSTVAVRVNAVPFTRLDFVLLLAGGGMLLVLGSSIRRVRAEDR